MTTSFISSSSFRPLFVSPPHPNRLILSPSTLKFQLPNRCIVNRNHPLNFRPIMAGEGNPEVVGVPKSLPVRVAHELLLAGHRYLDVRTGEEFSAGHPAGATNIPYMFRAGNGMTKNPNFVEEVSSQFGKDDEIIVGCQSGKRSLMAATDLSYAGFTGITDIAGGYSAWTQNGLPTE
ncbi:sulfurtransferase protein 16 [Tasmannia lanceolata]|uniref:sulfurtransferase protein 16 n=1 Tax=Tasmannia lanceolata TaxID=3420 RepID=UPI00406292DB